ncbi:hypothetical protein GCM10023323_69840 [Streptomyces thinghirensis]|uniref:Uncharacterized protein n=1 Tax=Streptomyces thinghirensis TaxID=551547 RepID=A0ABP9TGY7_9ACTN
MAAAGGHHSRSTQYNSACPTVDAMPIATNQPTSRDHTVRRVAGVRSGSRGSGVTGDAFSRATRHAPTHPTDRQLLVAQPTTPP